MAHCNLYSGQIFLSTLTSSLIETRYLLLSSMPTVADCALLCLDSTSCQTAVFNGQIGACAMFVEDLDTSGQLLPASSNSVTTISVNKNISPPRIFISPNATIQAVWNVSAGGNSSPALSGNGLGRYWYDTLPSYVFDGNLTTDFCQFGFCNGFVQDYECGQKTGVYVTPQHGPFVLDAFQIASGHHSSPRDPITITIEGSNQNGSALTLGSSWTLIYNGTSGLATNPGRLSLGVKQNITNNTVAFASYRFLVVEKRGSQTCVEYAEIQLFGRR